MSFLGKPLDDSLQRWEIDDEQRRLAEALDFPPQNETWFSDEDDADEREQYM